LLAFATNGRCQFIWHLDDANPRQNGNQGAVVKRWKEPLGQSAKERPQREISPCIFLVDENMDYGVGRECEVSAAGMGESAVSAVPIPLVRSSDGGDEDGVGMTVCSCCHPMWV
jgi:hypothetical protein